MTKKIIYQVLPRFWGSGRLSDFDTPALERLVNLGFSHIWFTGIVRHATGEPFVKGNPGSPYAISDYYDVNPYLADNEENRMSEFDALVERCHRLGLGVIIDFVPNHVARNYSDAHGGIPLLDRCDYDWTDTLKIDYSNPRTFGAMCGILRFWASRGVDGFRCDMVELVPQDFFACATSVLKTEFPDILFIGEAYDCANYRPLTGRCGFDLLYDKSGAYDTLRGILCSGRSAEELSWNWQSLGDLQPKMLNFLENHDEQRLASRQFLARPSKAFAALAFSALFNTASFMVYAGQETGEDASESTDGRTSIFNHTRLRSFGSPVIGRYEEILRLASSPLFAEGGNWDLGYCNRHSDGFDVTRHFAFLRYLGQETALVVCNFSSDIASISVRLPEEFGSGAVRVAISPYDCQIIKINNSKL